LGGAAGEAGTGDNKEIISALAFSPDGKRILTGSPDGTIRIWEVATGKLILPPLVRDLKNPIANLSDPSGKLDLSAGKARRAPPPE
jgi:WD40 repeat protein